MLDRVLAVAALDDFKAGADEAEGAFGHEQDALLVVFAEADARSEARFGVGSESGHCWRSQMVLSSYGLPPGGVT